MTLEDKVVPLWLVVYDQDPTKSYVFADQRKVLLSVEGSIKQMIPDCPANTEAVDRVIDKLKESWAAPFLLIPMDNMTVFVHRLELDKHNPIHKALCKAIGSVSDAGVRDELASFFVDPNQWLSA